jgi:hypothetical protein
MLPARAPKKQKRSTRWKSQTHRTFVCKEFACANCGATAAREAAHVRMNSGAGIGEKPDDWRVVPLCGGPMGCHAEQHRIGEPAFWSRYHEATGQDVEQLIASLILVSPRRREIEDSMRERGQ